MKKMDLHTPHLVNENIESIAQLFPNCVTETTEGIKIDFDQLRQELSDDIVEGGKERYRLDWPGKREAIVISNLPTTSTLRPARDESVDFDNTKNIYIEGDNLEVLKILQESYLNKIKMIYIDPPYNTGEDFIFKDDFTVGEAKWRESEERDEEGNRLVANPETAGRYHSDWLSMMYPRLRLARNLLKENGAIFISIGVEEVANLKRVMDDIFGESNFVEIFSWVKTSTPPALSNKSRKTNEYIICYEKNKNTFQYRGELLDGDDQPLLNRGNPVRKLIFPKESFYFNKNRFPNGSYNPHKTERIEVLNSFNIIDGRPDQDVVLKGEFKWTQDFLNDELAKETIFIVKSKLFSVRFLRKEDGFKRPTNYIKDQYTNPLINKSENNVGTNENASSHLRELMGSNVFSYPKPVSLMEYLINFIIEDNDIVLDFFSGSGTIGEAVMKYNSKNPNANIEFILVQLPEDLDQNLLTADAKSKVIIQNGIDLLDTLGKPHYITELAKERIRRAAAKIKARQETTEKINTGDMFEQKKDTAETNQLDLGFRVYKLDSSNMKDVYYRPSSLEQDQLDMFSDNIKADRTEEDLVTQVMLDWGLPLSLKIKQKEISGNKVYTVADDYLYCCFDKGVNEEFAREVAKDKPLRIVFRDGGFANDTAKENVKQLLQQLTPETQMRVI